MKVKLPNGQIINNVPEGTTRIALLIRLYDNNKLLNDKKEPVSDEEFQSMVRSIEDEKLSIMERATIGFGRGVKDVGEDVRQLGTMAGEAVGVLSEGSTQQFTEQATAERELFERGDLGAAGTIGRIGGNIAVAAPAGGMVAQGVKQVVPRAAQAAAAFSRAHPVTAAAGIGAAGGASVFTEEGDSRLANTGAGAIFGVLGRQTVNFISQKLQTVPRKISFALQRKERRRHVIENLTGELPDDEVRRIADDVADGFTVDQAIAKAQIERIPGALPTRGRISGELSDLQTEVRLNRIPTEDTGAIKAFQDVVENNNRAVLKHAENLLEEVGPPIAPGAAGTRARDVLIKRKGEVKEKVVDPLYERAGQTLQAFGDDIHVFTSKVSEVVNREIDNFTLDNYKPIQSVLKKHGIIADNDIFVAKLTPKQSNNLWKSLSRLKVKGEAKAAVAELKNALEADVKENIGEDLYRAAARVSKKEFYDKFVNPAKVRGLIEGDISPEKIAQQMRSTWNLDETEQFIKVLGEVDPESLSGIRRAVADDIYKKLFSMAKTVKGEPEINLRSFVNGVRSVGKEKTDVIFGDDVYKTMERFAESIGRLTSVDRRAAGPNTANDLINLTESIQATGYTLLNKARLLGNILIGAAKMVGRSGMQAQNIQKARSAINIALLRNENVLGDLLGQTVSVGGTLAAGQQGPDFKDEMIERWRKVFKIEENNGN